MIRTIFFMIAQVVLIKGFPQNKNVTFDQQSTISLNPAVIADSNLLIMSSISRYAYGERKDFTSMFVTNYWFATAGSKLEKYKGKIIQEGLSLRQLYYMAYADIVWNYPLSMTPGTGVYPVTVKWPQQKR